jgi:hypothetical protein
VFKRVVAASDPVGVRWGLRVVCCRLFRVVSGVLPLPLVGETIGVDRGPQRRGGLLEGDGQRVDLAGQLSALVRNHLIGGGLGRVDALADGVMMTARVVELHRVLKPTGSLYLHCDPTASGLSAK